MRAPEQELVTTYGYTRSGRSWVARPRSRPELAECLDFARSRGLSICAAGGRNSFGDVFLLTGQLVVDLSGLDRIRSFDTERGLLVVEPGVRVPDLLARIMPEGFFLCGLSGSLWNTVGGNLATNIHGKDSWRDGNFVYNVHSFRLLQADGVEVSIDRESAPDHFHAAVGGLGLLGIVTEVTLTLRRIPSVQLLTRSRRVSDFTEMIDAFDALDPRDTDFAYGWVDAFASGPASGRGVFETARFATGFGPGSDDRARAALPSGLVPPKRVALLRPESFWNVYRGCWDALVAIGAEQQFHRAMNRLKLARAPRGAPGPERGPIAFPDFQYPMVKLFSHWRDKFRPHGFHEIQTLFPRDAALAGFRALLQACRSFGVVPEVCSIRGHREDPTLLAFKGDGLSMTVNHPLKHFPPSKLAPFRDALLAVALEHGGRTYLAKFPWLPRPVFHDMFPEHARFRAIKDRLDPERLFWSDAAEHLFGEAPQAAGAGSPRVRTDRTA